MKYFQLLLDPEDVKKTTANMANAKYLQEEGEKQLVSAMTYISLFYKNDIGLKPADRKSLLREILTAIGEKSPQEMLSGKLTRTDVKWRTALYLALMDAPTK